MIRAGIVGATGLVGESLVRALLGHPEVEVTVATSAHAAGQRLAEKLPALRGEVDLVLAAPEPGNLVGQVDVAFLATKGPESMVMAPPLLEAGVKVIDIGGEFRLKSAADYRKWYGREHTCPGLLAEAAYGLPELFEDDIKKARLVANPGCYPTGAVLAVAPLLAESLVEPGGLIFDSYSGLSGAGRTYSAGARNLYQDCNENLRAYAVGTHKHTPEIERSIEHLAGAGHGVTFVPHLAPLDRGILTTAYAGLTQDVSVGELVEVYRDFYDGQRFVQVLDEGKLPGTKHVSGSNNCHIGLAVDEDAGLLIAVSAIDNLVKGLAGAAVQCMNLMRGYEESTGVSQYPVWP